MIISHSHRFVFVKTRKTAGSSLEAYLRKFLDPNKDVASGGSELPSLNDADTAFVRGKKSLGHSPLAHIQNHSPKTVDYCTFTIERNPWDKCISQWWFHKRKNGYKDPFNRYIKDKNGLPRDWALYTINGEVKADLVLRYENLREDIETLGSVLKLPLSYDDFAQHRLKAGYRPEGDGIADYYDEETTAIVAEAFRNEIREFGYAAC